MAAKFLKLPDDITRSISKFLMPVPGSAPSANALVLAYLFQRMLWHKDSSSLDKIPGGPTMKVKLQFPSDPAFGIDLHVNLNLCTVEVWVYANCADAKTEALANRIIDSLLKIKHVQVLEQAMTSSGVYEIKVKVKKKPAKDAATSKRYKQYSSILFQN
jgi:hypothetical protein